MRGTDDSIYNLVLNVIVINLNVFYTLIKSRTANAWALEKEMKCRDL